MAGKNKDVKKQMQNWELQQKQESQQDLRNQNEYMNDKYQQMKSNYTGFNNKKTNSEEAVFKNESSLTDKNPYMRYELNNTFNDKDRPKKEK